MLEKPVQNYNAIDLLKFIMSFAVIAIHTRPLANIDNIYISEICSIFFNMAVPFFFLASGYLLSSKSSKAFSCDNMPMVKKHMLKMAKMYLFGAIAYSPLAIYYLIQLELPFIGILASLIKGFFLLGENYNSYHLWYLLSTTYTLVVLIFLMKHRLSDAKIMLIVFLFSIISFGASTLSDSNNIQSDFLSKLGTVIRTTIINGRILTGLVYIPIGMYLAHKKIPLIIYIVMFFSGFIFTYACKITFFDYYSASIASIGLFGCTTHVKLKNHNIYIIFRRSSTIIYLIHMYVWTFYYMIAYGSKTFGFKAFVFTSIFSFLIAIVYIKSIDKIKTIKNK